MRRSSPTRTRAAIRPSRGWRSSRSPARPKAFGAHHESSSLNATYGVLSTLTPRLRAAAPISRLTLTSPTWRQSPAGGGVAEPLSTTTTDAPSRSPRSSASVRRRVGHRSRVTITTPVRGCSDEPTRWTVGPQTIPATRPPECRYEARDPDDCRSWAMAVRGFEASDEISRHSGGHRRWVSLFFTPEDLFALCEVADPRGSRRASTGGRPMSD